MGALLTITEAARVLRMRDATAARWLSERDLILDLDGRPRVIEADMLAKLRAESARSLPARRPLARALPAGSQDPPVAKGKRPRRIQHGDLIATVMKRDGRVQREDGRYYWRARRGSAQALVWSGWATRAEADAAVEDAIARERLVAAGHAPVDDELTVDELLDAWFEAIEARGRIAQSTLRTYRSSASAIRRQLGDRRVVDITRRHLDAYVRQRLSDGLKAAGIKGEAKVWRAAVQWGIDGERLSIESPRLFPPLHYEPERGSKAPPVAVLRRMFEHLDEHAIDPASPAADVRKSFALASAVLRFMALSGARIAEAWALAWEDVEDGWVTLRGKTGDRRIPVPPRVMGIVSAQPRVGPRVFTKLGLGQFKRRIYEVLHALPWSKWDSEELRSHDFRAFFVQRCYDQGLPLHVSSHLAGHSPAIALRHYVTAQAGELVTSMQKMALDDLLEVRVIDIASRRQERE